MHISLGGGSVVEGVQPLRNLVTDPHHLLSQRRQGVRLEDHKPTLHSGNYAYGLLYHCCENFQQQCLQMVLQH